MFRKKSIWLALSAAVVFGSAFGQLSVTPALPERAWTHTTGQLRKVDVLAHPQVSVIRAAEVLFLRVVSFQRLAANNAIYRHALPPIPKVFRAKLYART